MYKPLLCLILAMTYTQSALTAEDGSGTYVGLGGGYSYYTAGFFISQYYIDETIATSNIRFLEDSATGFKIYGGYQFNKIVAVEAAYTEYGRFNTARLSSDPNSFSLYANLGYNFLNGQLRPFGLIGLGYLKSYQSPDLLTQNFTTLHGGLGIEYSPTALKGFGFRASFDWDVASRNENAIDENNNQQTTALFYQYYGLWSLGAQYKF